MTATIPPLSDAVRQRLKAAVGDAGWSEDAARIAPKLVEWRERWNGATPLLLLPASTQEVATVVAICAETGTPLTPQGGNTGLVGGQIPRGEVLLSLERMNRILDVDTADDAITVQAGATLAAVQQAARDAGRRFPLSLASEGSCTIGGNISTNAGGTAVLRFGNMRDLVLGLEAVLPNGRIWNGLKRLRKDNTGYDLKQLLIGGEGTLGVVTAASLKLFAQPASRAVAVAAVETPQGALALLKRAREIAGGGLEAFELMDDMGLEFVLRHIPGSRAPLETRSDWLVLVEIASELAGQAEATMEALLTAAFEEALVVDAAIAQNETQAAAFWALRENQSAAQKTEGPAWKHDISVPVSAIPEFLREAGEALRAFSPGIRIPAFGHVGDGNLHYDILAPEGADVPAHLARREEAALIVNAIVARLGGSISAEHGIGVMKAEQALHHKDPVEIAAYRAIRAALDPGRIMNPRVLF
jgi:FAD/FMN-containing dehydrogenase